MSELPNQPVPSPGAGFDRLEPAKSMSVADAAIAPIVALRPRPLDVEPPQSSAMKVPMRAVGATPDAAARAHGRSTRHRVRQPGTIGAVTVRAPMLDPTRTNVESLAQPFRLPAHPRVGARRSQILRAQRRARLRPLLWPCVVAALLAGLLGVCFGSPLFTIRTVRTNVAGTAAQQAELRRITAGLAGSNLIRFDVAKTSRVIRSLPWVASVDVRRDIPATLTVRVRAHDLAGAVALTNGRFALTASDGVVVAVVPPNATSLTGLARIDLGPTKGVLPGDVLPALAVDVLRGAAAVGRLLPGQLASATLRGGNLTWTVRPLVGTRTIRVAVGSPAAGEIAASALGSVLARLGPSPIAVDLRTPDTPVLEIPSSP